MASQVRLTQGEADMLDDLHSARMKVRLLHSRRATSRAEGIAGVHAAAGHRRPVRSLPSGPAAPDMRTLALGLALLVPSAIVLAAAFGGYLGISALRVGWESITRRGSKR